MNTKRYLNFLVLICAVIIACFAVNMLTTYAEKMVITAEGYAIMGDGPEENPAVAQERARKDAKRAASEKAGVYVESISEVKNGQLTRDEIRTISANILEVQSDPVTAEVLGGTAIKYTCHITVLVDTDIVVAQLHKGKDKLEDAVKLNQDQDIYIAQNDAELAELKEKYKNASEPERAEINKEVKRNEEKFTATQLHSKGAARYQLDDLDGAVELFNQAIATDPLYSAPWSGLGWIHNDRKEYDKAIECFKKAIELYDLFAPAWNGLGCAYNYKGTNEHNSDYYNKAIEYCQKAVELDPNYAAPWNNLGYAYDKLKNYEKAIECYNKAIELDDKDAVPWSNIGNAYDGLGNYEKAVECYNKSLEINPNYANAWNNLGYTFSRKGDHEKAIEYYQKAIELDPNYAAPWNGLGYVYNFKQDFKKAVECCKKAVKIDPKYSNAWNNLGYSYGGLGNYRQSYEAYKKAAQIDPDVEMYQKNLETAKKRI